MSELVWPHPRTVPHFFVLSFNLCTFLPFTLSTAFAVLLGLERFLVVLHFLTAFFLILITCIFIVLNLPDPLSDSLFSLFLHYSAFFAPLELLLFFSIFVVFFLLLRYYFHFLSFSISFCSALLQIPIPLLHLFCLILIACPSFLRSLPEVKLFFASTDAVVT